MRKSAKIPAAMAWLRANMTPSKAYDAGEMLAAAQRAGHKERTLQYAAERLHIRKKFVYVDGAPCWQWTLPASYEADDPSASPVLQLVTT